MPLDFLWLEHEGYRSGLGRANRSWIRLIVGARDSLLAVGLRREKFQHRSLHRLEESVELGEGLASPPIGFNLERDGKRGSIRWKVGMARAKESVNKYSEIARSSRDNFEM